MKFIITNLLFLITICFSNSTYSQSSFTDTISVITYNVNNYGTPSSGSCPTTGSPLRHGYLKNILQYLQSPDIIGFEKIYGTPNTFCTDTIRMKVMDSICKGCYSNTVYTNVSGYKKTNMLFYKNTKFGYLGTIGIYTADNNISDINLHKLYYKSPSLPTTHDTIFLNVIVVHDKSGSGVSDSATRSTEIGGAMSWLAKNVHQSGNYIIMGDFNTQSSNEGCFQQMINNTDTLIQFYDPPNQLGLWSANPTAFSMYLTQSTRTTDPGDCASTSGMNNRYDHLLLNRPIMNGYKNIQYIAGSYKVVGQDGLHYNQAINASPTNNSVPPNVLNSLYLMSEHLPVAVKLIISKPKNSLPVNFLSFRATYLHYKVSLEWSVGNDDETNYYVIERSMDRENYFVLDSIFATQHNRGKYSYFDRNLSENKTLYYRIKQYHKNGSVQYSTVQIITINSIYQALNIYPNPLKNTLAFDVESIDNGLASVDIINSVGQVVMHIKTVLATGIQHQSIDVAKLLHVVYLLKLTTLHNSYSAKFIVE